MLVCACVPEAFLQNYIHVRTVGVQKGVRTSSSTESRYVDTVGIRGYLWFMWLLHALSKYCPGFSVSAVGS